MSNDWAIRVEAARKKLPLQMLMAQHGFVCEGRKFKKCPFCQHKDSAGFFNVSDGVMFKCHHSSCPSGTQADGGAWDEVGFLAYHLGVSRKDACIVLMKEAGVWQEARLAPSVMPGKSNRKQRLQPPEEGKSETEQKPDFIPQSGTNEGNEGGEPEGEVPPSPRPSPPGEGEPSPDPAGSASAGTLESAAAGGGDLEATQPRSGEGAGGAPSAEEPPGNPPGLPPDPEDRPEGGSPAIAALRWFYERTGLSDLHRQELWEKRGITAQTCELAGLKSSVQSNKEILLEAEKHFTIAVLVEAGLWVPAKSADRKPAPNAQLYGFGFVRKGDAIEGGGRGEDIWDWTYPVIIPYFDHKGDLIHLRPHKGALRDRDSRLFIARIRKGEDRKAPSPRPSPPGEGEPSPDPAGSASAGVSESAAAGGGDREATQPRSGEIMHQPRAEFAMVNEGEFKALAVWQALGYPKDAIASLPGIQMSKPLFGDIEDWLEILSVKRVIVSFDNEDKGTEGLPGYKKEKWKRHDAEIWSRYLAEQVTREGYEGQVCLLPDAWRNEQGKADWDGGIRKLIDREWGRRSKTPSPQPSPPGEEEASPGPVAGADGKTSDIATREDGPGPEQGLPPSSNEIWELVKEAVGREARKVLGKATEGKEVWQFFDAEARKHIQNGVARISFEPQLPAGGEAEVIISRRLQRYLRRLKDDTRFSGFRGILQMLAGRYRELQAGYYKFKPFTEKRQDLVLKLRTTLGEEDVEARRACEVMMKGIPERVSNFVIDWHYEMIRPDGKRDRLVTLESVDGRRSKTVSLPSSAFASPKEFRCWLLDQGGYAWQTGEKELQALHADSGKYLVRLEVEQVTVRAWHDPAKAWFFGDACYASEDREIAPDENGIFWLDNQGYKLSPRDQEGQIFRQGTPKMRPLFSLALGKEESREAINRKTKKEREEAGENELEATGKLFLEICENLYWTLGGYDGWMTLGLVMAYGAAPEIFRQEGGFPGLWFYGHKGQGKGTIAKWMLYIWGFHKRDEASGSIGTIIGGSSNAGLGIALQQYGNLPAWLDEYQPGMPDWVNEKLKNMWDRAGTSKKTIDDRPREIVGGAIVSGIATSPDAQLRSRYVHVSVGKSRRIEPPEGMPQVKEWFEAHKRDLFCLGRFILRNRKEFARMCLVMLKTWQTSAAMAPVEERAAFNYGVSYAAMMSMQNLLHSYEPQRLTEFRKHIEAYCLEQEKEVERRVEAKQFWQDLMAAFDQKDFYNGPGDLLRIFKVMDNPTPTRALPEEQVKMSVEDTSKGWKHRLLYFRPEAVIDIVALYNRKLGKNTQLSQSDLQSQMRQQPYWRPAPKGQSHRQRFFGDGPKGRTGKLCWCIDLDWHELGYQAALNGQWDAALHPDGQPDRWVERGEWVDPRKGDLFALVDYLVEKKQEHEESVR